MEGSRHERAVTVLVSYGIGFVTAFILYASFVEAPMTDTFVSTASVNTATVYDAVKSEISDEVTSEAAGDKMAVTYQDGQLTVERAGVEKLLSFNANTAKQTIDLTTLPQGYHYGALHFTESQNGQYVFFCERQTESKPSCLGFVYDAKEDVLHRVVKNGVAVTISESSAENATFAEAGLVIGSNYSVNPSTPWVLLDEEAQLDLQ